MVSTPVHDTRALLGPRVALVSPHRLATDLLAKWLTGNDLSCVIDFCNDPASALEDQRPVDIMVLGNLLNIMAPADVVEWIKARRARMPDTAVVVISDCEDGAHSVDCLRAGARGYIPTSLSLPLAFAALRLVLSGGIYIPSMALGLEQTVSPAAPSADPLTRVLPLQKDHADDVADDVAPEVARPEEPAVAELPTLAERGEPPKDQPGLRVPMTTERIALARQGLSPRETDILLLLQRGASNRMMAAKLGISENTVMVHMRNVMRKLGATNRTQAVYTASRLQRESG